MEYPFYSGFADQVGIDDGIGATYHIPMPPKTHWDDYQKSLHLGLDKIKEFQAEALILSMGLDTHENDPCAIRRAGFCLKGNDYYELGKQISCKLMNLPTVIIQEGGYRLDTIGEAATNVMYGFRDEILSGNGR
jgi:acetoin utilization deacetylase AcuC-like enzyme